MKKPRKRSTIRKARAAILSAAEKMQTAGADLRTKRLAIGGKRPERVVIPPKTPSN